MTTTPARDELRKYVNLLADSWTPRERTDERVEWLYSLVRAEVLATFTQTEARAEADRHAAEVRAAALTEAAELADDINGQCGRAKPCPACVAREDLADALRDKARRMAAAARPASKRRVAPLGTSCAGCGHSANWHNLDGLCTVGDATSGCPCRSFTTDTTKEN